MGQIYYEFAQGLNFIDPNGFNTTIFWDEITIWIKETNLTLTLLRIVDVLDLKASLCLELVNT